MTYVSQQLKAMGVENFQVCYSSQVEKASDIVMRARSAKLNPGGLVVLQSGRHWPEDWTGDMAASHIAATVKIILENNQKVKVAVIPMFPSQNHPDK
ncbi:hypothetical protein SK128_011487, partial [Halocaridina rubra]